MDSSTYILYVSIKAFPKVPTYFEIPANCSSLFPQDFIIGFASSNDMNILNMSLKFPFYIFLILILNYDGLQGKQFLSLCNPC
jgi:hypothetical protein